MKYYTLIMECAVTQCDPYFNLVRIFCSFLPVYLGISWKISVPPVPWHWSAHWVSFGGTVLGSLWLRWRVWHREEWLLLPWLSWLIPIAWWCWMGSHRWASRTSWCPWTRYPPSHHTHSPSGSQDSHTGGSHRRWSWVSCPAAPTTRNHTV